MSNYINNDKFNSILLESYNIKAVSGYYRRLNTLIMVPEMELIGIMVLYLKTNHTDIDFELDDNGNWYTWESNWTYNDVEVNYFTPRNGCSTLYEALKLAIESKQIN